MNHFSIFGAKLARRMLASLLAAAMCLSVCGVVHAQALKSGDYRYTLNDQGEAIISSWRGKDTKLVIPEKIEGHKVVGIGDGAFAFKKTLTSIKLPSTLRSIGKEAFQGCYTLSALTLPKALISIGDGAFNYCDALKNLTLPLSLKEIGVNPFESCKQLRLQVSAAHPAFAVADGVLYDKSMKTLLVYPRALTLQKYSIPEGTEYIADIAFSSNKELAELTIPLSLTGMGANPFTMKSRTEFVIAPDHPVFECVDEVLFDKLQKKLIYYPTSIFSSNDYAIPQGTEIVGDLAFAYSNLVNITIPDSVKTIGAQAFSSCSSLPALLLPDSVTSIGDGAFSYCKSLVSISIPATVTKLGDEVFSNCAALSSVELPDGLTLIPKGMFDSCSALQSLAIPAGVTAIGDSTFAYCASLTRIALPLGLTSIGSIAFYKCTALQSVEIPQGVTSIGAIAFYGCAALQSITIPGSVTEIGVKAFLNCSPELLIAVEPGSYAERYAIDAGLKHQ